MVLVAYAAVLSLRVRRGLPLVQAAQALVWAMTEQRYAEIKYAGGAARITVEEAAEYIERHYAELRHSWASRGMPRIVTPRGTVPVTPDTVRAPDAAPLPVAIARYRR